MSTIIFLNLVIATSINKPQNPKTPKPRLNGNLNIYSPNTILDNNSLLIYTFDMEVLKNKDKLPIKFY